MTFWIGRVDPSMWWQGAWWQELLPPDVRLAILSLGVQRLTDDQLERAHEMILEKVEMLDREEVDVINVGGSPVVGVHGRAGHDRLLADIGRITQRPHVTALQAEMEAFAILGGRRIAMAAPYPVRQTEKRVSALQEYGVEVIGYRTLDIERNRFIAELDPADVRAFAIEVGLANPSADVLYAPCGAFPVTRVIADIERQTGLPVVTNVQAQAAACLRRIGYPRPVTGFGRLLETIGRSAA
jgi:maleate cis-trans isomerase